MSYLIETARTGIRCLENQDLDNLMTIYANPHIMENSIYGVQSKEQVQALIMSQCQYYKQWNYSLWVVIDLESQQLIGCAGLENKKVDGEVLVTIAYRFCEGIWGRGLATEVVEAILTYAHQVLKLPAIYAIIKPDNEPSKRVAEKAGFIYQYATQYLTHPVELYKWS